jgi:cob(I)alamin adenosyltransferase
MNSGEYDVIILDEVCVAVKYGLISEKDLIRLIETKPETMTMVLTGRYAAPDVIKNADHAVEMIPIAHYFEKGVKARIGIEK